MSEFDPIAVLIATVAAFVASGVWYTFMPDQPSSPAGDEAPHTDATSPPILLAEITRSAVVAAVVAGLAAGLDAVTAPEGALLGLLLWVGFPAVLFVGSIIHEHYPARLAVTHLGDWLVKLALIGALVGALQ